MTELDGLKALTTVVGDTGDIDEIARVKPAEATTNPSLILKAAGNPAYARYMAPALAAREDAALRIDRVLVAFGCAILEHVPGRVSTEVDARLSFDAAATAAKARRII
ncbi:MAG: transaldolase, partial [Duodenibacillus sp.]|nr:transaldolase [Duodenibacillus sp.]